MSRPPPSPRRLAALAALLALPAPALAQADPAGERRPLLEIGLLGGGGYVPDYPGAEQSRLRGIVSPSLTYRGDLFRADELGARMRAWRDGRAEFSLSASGAFPVSSRENRARQGMPDLDWLGEIGPTLRLTLWRDPAAPRRVMLETPVRAVFSTDLSSISFRGWVFNPDIAWEQRDLLIPRSRFRIGLGAVFADARHMDYFYGVAPEFARPDRPAYRARAGYLGARLQFSYRVPITGHLAVIAGARFEDFSGAANADSPLFRRDRNLSVAAGFVWTLYRSADTVPAPADPLE
ncbi:MipA/OmpV family protein [Caldovatus aquaticus]|uniref:MipA/OmpV family protein n=1 Tax=Caldovatus aquaticus TaxID=2865671 RepID=A0ABS7F5D9_9PROT|nr:MipA/OmpV family protein [Caldovatus aquaticus]MBW8270523.1 MipA/OmpV family protein [Caldovatus aquaticus]